MVVVIITVHIIIKAGNHDAIAVAIRVERRSKFSSNGGASAIIGGEPLLLNRRAVTGGLMSE